MPKSVERVPNKLPRQITFLHSMFVDCTDFNQDISSWDVSNVIYMIGMFYGAIKFNNNDKPLTWGEKVKNVTYMQWMFENAISFNQDLSKWNVAKVKNWDLFAKNSGFGNQPKKWHPFKK